MWNGVQKRIASSRGFIVRDGYPDPSWPEYFEDSYVVPTAVDYVCQLRPQPDLCSKKKKKEKKEEKRKKKKKMSKHQIQDQFLFEVLVSSTTSDCWHIQVVRLEGFLELHHSESWWFAHNPLTFIVGSGRV